MWAAQAGDRTVTLTLGMPVWATHRRGEPPQLALVRGVREEWVDVMLSDPPTDEQGNRLYTVVALHFSMTQDGPAWSLADEGPDWNATRGEAQSAQARLDQEFQRLFGDLS